MADAVAIVVFVAAAHGSSTATTAMMGAARQTLGPDANVTLQAVEQLPTSDDAALFGDMLGSDAVVEVTWPEEKFGRARIRVYARRRSAWVEQEVTFATADAEPERGRTVGYAFAAMMPAALEPAAPIVPEPPPAVTAPVPATADVPPPAPVRDDGARPRSPWLSLEARGVALYSGSTSLLGGGLGARWLASSSWVLGVGGDVRRGTLGGHAADDARLFGSIALRSALTPQLEAAMNVELFATRLRIERASASRIHWLPGLSIGPQLQWLVTPRLAAALCPAVEIATGQALVTVGGVPEERLAPIRWTLALAVRGLL